MKTFIEFLTEETNSVGDTIYTQLGGNKFAAMTGAKNFVKSDNKLTFKLPLTKGKLRINYVVITLNSNDTYDIEFCKFNKTDVKVLDTSKNVQVSELQRVFTEKTGLYTRLF